MTARRYQIATREGFCRYYDDAFPAVYRYASRLTGGDRALTEDLVQEAFADLARAVKASQVDDVDVGWIIVVARRRYLDHARRSRRELRRLERIVGHAPDPPPIDPQTVTSDIALRALRHLDDSHRAALVLRYIDDLPVPVVARSLERSVAATESLLARARRELRRLLQEASDA